MLKTALVPGALDTFDLSIHPFENKEHLIETVFIWDFQGRNFDIKKVRKFDVWSDFLIPRCISNYSTDPNSTICDLLAFALSVARVYKIPVFLGTPFATNGMKLSLKSSVGLYTERAEDRKRFQRLDSNIHEELSKRLVHTSY